MITKFWCAYHLLTKVTKFTNRLILDLFGAIIQAILT